MNEKAGICVLVSNSMIICRQDATENEKKGVFGN
jgi:hypothetical protein